jgi:hypothetical protein
MFKNGTISLIALAIACQLTGCRSLPLDIHACSTESDTAYDVAASVETESPEDVKSSQHETHTSTGAIGLQAAAFQQVAPLQMPQSATTPQPISLNPVIATDSLEDLETLALENNPALARAYAVVSGRHGRWIQAGLPPNPTIGYIGEDLGDDDTLGTQGAFIAQEFVRGGKLGWSQA